MLHNDKRMTMNKS